MTGYSTDDLPEGAPSGPAGRDDAGRFRPLHDEVRFLGALLGEVLREQGGEELFAAVERVRLAARQLRQNLDGRIEQELTGFLSSLPTPLAVQVARAFTVYFELTNLAEQHHRARRRREYQRLHPNQAQVASLRALALELRARGLEATEALDLLCSLSIELVLTAHPTEAARRTVLGILRDLYGLLDRREDPRITPAEQEEIRERIKELITLRWQTSEIRSRRPEVADELRRALFFVDATLFDGLPLLHEALERELAGAYPELAPRLGAGERLLPPLVRLRSWVGGDRDGNPEVTAAITWEALCRQRDLAVRRYMKAVRLLMARFAQSSRLVPVSSELVDSVAADEAALQPPPLGFIRWNEDEPYRRKLAVMYWRLELLRRHNLALQAGWHEKPQGTDGRYRSAEEFMADLRLIERSLLSARGQAIVRGSLGRLIRQVQLFGFHLAPIEVREHSDAFGRAVAELLRATGVEPRYLELDEPSRQRLLTSLLDAFDPFELSGKLARLPGEALSGATRELLRTFEAVAAARAEMGPQAVDTCLVSMAHQPSDVLEALLLARLGEARALAGSSAGSPQELPQGGAIRECLRVVPIIETIQDLRAAPARLGELLALPVFCRYLSAWGGVLEVMLGYSDTTKDGGYLAANWELYRAQREILALGKSAGVPIRFFHGRGGALGRGGGPATRAILALPPGATAAGIKLTEQGEVLSERYLIDEIAQRSLEQMVWAAAVKALEDRGGPRPSSRAAETGGEAGSAGGEGDAGGVKPEWEAWMDRLSAESMAAYRDLLFGGQEAGLRYFFSATPIAHIGELNIGSRPASREPGMRFEALRAIPWVFAWNQSRHLVPAWYGVGTAFEALAQDGVRGAVEALAGMYRKWPFFRAVIDNLQMALAKADMRIAALYAALAAQTAGQGEQARQVFLRIQREYDRTRWWVLRITGQHELLAREPALRESIRLRNPYVDALSYLQVLFLRRFRASPNEEDRFGILVTISGVAAGLRNTG